MSNWACSICVCVHCALMSWENVCGSRGEGFGLKVYSLQIVWRIPVISHHGGSENSCQAFVSMWQAHGMLPDQGVTECTQLWLSGVSCIKLLARIRLCFLSTSTITKLSNTWSIFIGRAGNLQPGQPASLCVAVWHWVEASSSLYSPYRESLVLNKESESVVSCHFSK